MRKVQRILKSIEAFEGAGFIVNRPFPVPGLCDIDPFLLIDELGPIAYAPGKALGASDHPHRGFETITYVLAGEVLHEDSGGFKSELKSGDAQIMTAGRGVIHSELPSPNLLKHGGVMHGVQIWVNLPKAKKLIEPRYQDLRGTEIPISEPSKGVRIKLLSGTLAGISGPAATQTPIFFAHVTLLPGAKWSSTEIPANYTTLSYVLSGSGEVADSQGVRRTDLVEFSRASGSLDFANRSEKEEFSFLLLAGAPIQEPIARMGPFVMNTEKELEAACNDYLAGRMGTIRTGSILKQKERLCSRKLSKR